MMENEIDTSGEWLVDQLRAMGKRLRKFKPHGKTQGEWAEDIGISTSGLSSALQGQNITVKNLLKIKNWMLRVGYTAEDRDWWENGASLDPFASAGGIVKVRKFHHDKEGSMPLLTGQHAPPPSRPSRGKRSGGQSVSQDE